MTFLFFHHGRCCTFQVNKDFQLLLVRNSVTKDSYQGRRTLNSETVSGTLWGSVAICPIIVNGDRLTAYNKRPNLAVLWPPTWGVRHSKMATKKDS
jgi:hypothetical protein